MWTHIRQSLRWNLTERFAVAARGLDLTTVSSIRVSLDPFHKDTESVRNFWFAVTSPRVKQTNPKVKFTHEIRNDGQAPFFEANTTDGRQLVFYTSGIHESDILMRFNRFLGNPEFGKTGPRPRPQS
ncbi:hypothetical protein M3Y94_01305100 [Aphelenchoides besseyi]|nr:hypothetical protein M3Y94_01305100 [Aphelenchoides besseyi]KAI6220217.1 hypothetical protein M3Y95_01061400 [Aphelenchoides besseyi]